MIRNITNIKLLDKIVCRFIQVFLLIKCEFIYVVKAPPIIKDENKTVEEITKNNKSISRFGDGEFELIKGNDIKFQKSSPLISRRLKEVLASDKSNLLIGLPKIFTKNDLNKKTRGEKVFWMESLALYSSVIYKCIDLKKIYYDSFFSRPYMGYADKSNCKRYFNKIKKIWNKRNVILVEGIYSRVGVGNNLFDNCSSLKRILAPCENAFDKYDEILNEVLKVDGNNNIILIALGPTATILAYDLAEKGYQAIDIGHIDIEYEWFLKGAEEKVVIKNKYTNEVQGGDYIQNLNYVEDKKYKREIVGIII